MAAKKKNQKLSGLNVLELIKAKKVIIIPVIAFLVPILFFMLAGNSKVAQKALGIFDKTNLSIEKAEKFTKAFIATEVITDQKVEIDDIKDLGSVYSFQLTIPNQGTYVSYISKDGQFIFPSGYDTKEFKQKVSAGEVSLEITPRQMPKSDRPQAQLFLMSFCPYGNQTEEIIMPVVDLLKDSADIIPRYIVSKTDDGNYSSLHGEQELNQDVRELCVYKYQPERFWDFLKAVNTDCTYENADNCWIGPARKVGIDINKISQCQRQEFKALLDQQISLTTQYSVSGSPTFLINEAAYTGNRTAEDFKQAVCSAFNNPPEECSTILENEAEAAQGGC